MTKFLDNFWDTDFNSTGGYEVLIKRMKDGREMCKALEELLKQRARAEDTFGRSLQRIAKNATGTEEIGGLRGAWDELVSRTEQMGTSHVQLGAKMVEEAKKIEDFREAQKEKRRKPEESTKKTQAVKRDWFNKVIQAKKTYENRCKDHDQADDHYMKQRLVVTPKEVDKLQAKKERCGTALESADAQYQASVKSLDEARREWEKQMEELCVVLQQMEEERIKFLRNSMWVSVNLVSLHCVQDDEHCEDTRKSLEKCSEENDIKLFVAQKKTGNRRPAPIEYENFYNNQKTAAAAPNGRTMPSPSGDAQRRRDPHTALPSIPSNTPNPVTNGNRRSLPRQQDGDPLYAAVDSPPPQSSAGSMQTLVRARFDYKAQGPSELSLSTGQILKILSQDSMDWWTAEHEGRRGVIPAQFVEFLTLNDSTEITSI
ncbi:proline-serine-threonine phosphatase-interacting protein 1-like isoform X1 [Diadema antillarum]|uniref:proline-serine-threonine phosphatase-interacting protein 1-like isoform X1 n=1 Tax=Diadema antillarum TaxID=105358 RepID=UPI003A851192